MEDLTLEEDGMRRGSTDWSPSEAEALATAVLNAPSVLNTQPWLLELDRGEASLVERRDTWLPFNDPYGRDRTISCGAAVPNLELAVRVLGFETATALLPDPGRPELVARVAAGTPHEPDTDDWRTYSAITRRRSHRLPFAEAEVPAELVTTVLRHAAVDGVSVRHVREVDALAAALEYAALAQQHDGDRQRELAVWTIQDLQYHRHGVGLPRTALPSSATLPWAGTVNRLTTVPDRVTLARWLSRETVLLFHTADDTRLDHLRAGMAMQRVWLGFVSAGLVAAVQTQPLHLTQVREQLVEALALPGSPQLLMRVGYSAGPAPVSPRRSAFELLHG
ncbi:Acg family FMN-binding oxidoreductase [Prauserella alba]|uniref:NAD(P)H nitroreductase n=1 Tax=Prauserella alba TaxID=176898 RepID=A0ABN1VCJ2_9PSEU|nr:nitroreductase family protein [Prauserella alba]MCP2182215.1 Nitroreductase family protein [Prauserella alba]